MSLKYNQAPIFIVGSPRSGTTLMRYCLNQHSNIFIPHETLFFAKVYGNRRLYPERSLAKYYTQLLDHLFYYGFSASSEFSKADFSQLKHQLLLKVKAEVTTYQDFASTVFTELARQQGKTRWGEKTPGHVFYLSEIFELFPDAKVINMQRSPKNVISSFLKSSHVSNDFLGALAKYKMSIKAANKWKQSILTIQYENLTHAPEEALCQVCEYIDEAFEPSMLTPGMQDSSYEKEAVIFDKGIGIKPENRNKWKGVLTPYQSELIDFVTKESVESAHQVQKFQHIYLMDMLKLACQELSFSLRLYKNRWGYQNIRGVLTHPSEYFLPGQL